MALVPWEPGRPAEHEVQAQLVVQGRGTKRRRTETFVPVRSLETIVGDAIVAQMPSRRSGVQMSNCDLSSRRTGKCIMQDPVGNYELLRAIIPLLPTAVLSFGVPL